MYYNRTIVPPEAPERRDHGDIDVLVDGPRFNLTGRDLERALGAHAHTEGGSISSFAIPIPGDDNSYFQLDVHLCKKGRFEWANVIYAYGDLWFIIGATVTRFGLAINDSGLHARVGQIQETNKKHCLLLLTSNPQDMMDFLGLDKDRYEKGFSTLDELFEWAISMPLFRRDFFEKETISEKEERIREKRPMYSMLVTKWLREKRPMYSMFMTEWLPQKRVFRTSTGTPGTCDYLPAGPSLSAAAQHLENGPLEEGYAGKFGGDERGDLLNKALQRFNKHEEYHKMLEDHRKRTLKDAMWKKVASELPLKGKELGQRMMALKAQLWWNDGQPTLRVGGDKSLEKVPALDADTVDKILIPWIKDHWRDER